MPLWTKRWVGASVSKAEARIHQAGVEVACHDKRLDRRERAVDHAYLHGIVPGRWTQGVLTGRWHLFVGEKA